MLNLPKIPYRMEKNKSQIVAMRGINFSNMIADGDMVDSKNISARAYPYITTREAREDIGLEGEGEITAITSFGGKFVYARGGCLYYDKFFIGPITPGEKQFAAIGTKLVIMPDKVYFDMETMALYPMGAETYSANTTFTSNTMTITDGLLKLTHGYGGEIKDGVFTVNARKTIIPKGTLTKIFTVSETLSNGTFQYKYFVFYEHMLDNRDVEIGVFKKKSMVSLSGYKYYCYIAISSLAETERESILVGDVLSARDSSGLKNLGTVKEKDDDYIYLARSDSYLEELGEGIHERYSSVSIYREIDISSQISRGELCIISSEKGERDCSLYVNEAYVKVSSTELGHIAPDGLREDISLSTPGYDDLTCYVSVGDELRLISEYNGSETAVVSEVTETTITFTDSTLTQKFQPDYASPSMVTLYKIVDVDISSFKAGDVVFISGSENNDGAVYIEEVNGNTITVGDNIFVGGDDMNLITVERRIPELDYICESDNRIWGCSNADNTIYASALGDPTNFFDYSGESTDSYAVAVGSPERFTACCRYGGAVLFFKENKIHKVLGSYPAEYTLYSYDVEGVQEGSHKSLQTINEVLYYKGIHGVFAYNGSPRLISANFGEKSFGSAVAGNDGDTYYISMSDEGRGYLFAYETKHGMWVLEDDLKVVDFIKSRSALRMLAEGGKFFLCDAEESETGIEWHVQFAPFYETIEGKKSYSRIVFRLEIPQGSYMIVDVKTDGGAWREAGKVVGRRDGIIPVNVPINRCDKFEIRLRGKGKCTIHQMKREFFVGGDK